MPRHFTQADYNTGSPTPPGGHAVSYDCSTMSLDPNEVSQSYSPWGRPLKVSQSPRNAVADNRSKATISNNIPKAKRSSSGQQSHVTTPDQKSNPPPGRPFVQSVNSQQSHDDDSIHESQYQINMTRYEELFPDFTQGNIHDHSPPHAAAALPNAKELMSGVFEDGTPVFSPHAKKPRGSRFVSGSQSRDNSGKVEAASFVEEVTPQFDVKKPRGSRFGPAAHSRDVSLKIDTPKVVEEAQVVPPLFDEKKVLASLNFLEKKVAALEKNRTQDEITIHQLRLESRIARAESKERTKWRRSDSALGSTDGGSERGDEMSSSQRKLMVEKNRLEATVTALQNQVDQLNQAASVSETNINKVTRDRDQAVSQLGVAFFTVEQLKAEVQSLQNHSIAVEELEAANKSLREDNATLKHSVEQLIANQEDDTTMDMTQREEALDREFERRARLDAKQKQLDKTTTEKNDTKISSTSSRSSNGGDNESDHDITYLSVVDPGKIGKLRKTLENERIARKQAPSRRRAPEMDETDTSIQEKTPAEESSQQMQFSRRFSFGPSDPKEGAQQLITSHEPVVNKNARNKVDTPIIRTGSRFSQTKPEEMTSEWIVNDITLDFSGYESRAPSSPSKEAQLPYHKNLPPTFSLLDEHESNNSRSEIKAASEIKPASETKATFETNAVPETNAAPKSIAVVTNRVPEPALYEDDEDEPTMESVLYEEEPTLRPSQSPTIALKSVMQGLEDELSQAKRQFAQYQELYNHQNPALGKRARKSLKEKMEVLLRTIDGKADYIYSLHDVLEGQKRQGTNITPEQVQATLQSVGHEMPLDGIMSASKTKTSSSTSRNRGVEA